MLDVIYVLGTGHSGSTLLDLLLGSHSRVESTGEIHRFPSYMSANSKRPMNRRLCTCGVIVSQCPYWSKVKAELARTMGGSCIDLTADDQDEFERNNGAVVKAVLKVSAKEVFCESSKHLPRLLRLLSSGAFNIKIIHIVRDGRAVAFSHKKKAERTALGASPLTYYGALRNWQKLNLQMHRRLKRQSQYIRVRYEDLVEDPGKHVSRILEKVGLCVEPDQLRPWDIEHHNLGGNRLRLLGTTRIQRDTRYLRGLTHSEWWLGTTIAFLGLSRFGYPIRRGRGESLRKGRFKERIIPEGRGS